MPDILSKLQLLAHDGWINRARRKAQDEIVVSEAQ